MTKQTTKMICQNCGAEMNHHADKLVDPVRRDDLKHVDSALGGIVEETHCCPRCGAVESRRAG
jgi:ribosomal protein S27AE